MFPIKRTIQLLTAAIFCLFLGGLGLLHILLPDRPFSPVENRNLSQLPAFTVQKLADGSYTVSVALEGGSGKAKVDSPAALRVENGAAYVTVAWGSSSYDYMRIGQEKFLPLNTEGNSTFEIPVASFDRKLVVYADTTAMSTPHEISYRLTFRLGSAVSGSSPEQQEFQEQPSGEKDASPSVYLLAAGLAAAGAWFFPGRKKSGRRRRGG